MQTINQIKEISSKEQQKIRQLTCEKFGKELNLLNLQYDLLFEFLANFNEYDSIKREEGSQTRICHSLFAEILRKQQIAIELLLRGYYDEVGELVRHIMQSYFQILYLVRNKDSWKIWLMQQNYEQDKLNGTTKDPRTVFGNFTALLDATGNSEYRRVYHKLCSWSHPGIESLRSNHEFNPNGIHYYYYANRFSEEKAKGFLHILFGFVNDAFWKGFKDIFQVKPEELPSVLVKYKSIQTEIPVVFDGFYEWSDK